MTQVFTFPEVKTEREDSPTQPENTTELNLSLSFNLAETLPMDLQNVQLSMLGQEEKSSGWFGST